jgi:hypothetical protein
MEEALQQELLATPSLGPRHAVFPTACDKLPVNKAEMCKTSREQTDGDAEGVSAGWRGHETFQGSRSLQFEPSVGALPANRIVRSALDRGSDLQIPAVVAWHPLLHCKVWRPVSQVVGGVSQLLKSASRPGRPSCLFYRLPYPSWC